MSLSVMPLHAVFVGAVTGVDLRETHAGRIRGMVEPEARMLLLAMIEHATQPPFVYTQIWTVEDPVMWDSRCTTHRARNYDDTPVLDMHRTTVSDGASTVAEVA
jgi:alpha-ketoglutarate-dependent 2,4-dichlorophenoxyacetate dioxygenase